MLFGCRLTSLDLAHNQFTGDLHAYDWKAFTSLRHVNLTNNKFSGSLPASWGVFRGAAVIDASRNNITGSLPASWSEAGADGLMMPLAFLDVSRNSLTGELFSLEERMAPRRPSAAARPR